MKELLPREMYTPQAVAACEKALRTILRRIGPWGQRLVLVGGMAPRYLVPFPHASSVAHPGTTDLDVVIGIALAEDAECYRSLASNLKDCGFGPLKKPDGTPSSWQWRRDVDGVDVQLEFLCPLRGGPAGRLDSTPAQGVGSSISALRIPGAELVAVDFIEIVLSGELLDDGGLCPDPIPLRVANTSSYLTLKALALRDRLKEKDAFDLVWVITAHPDGPAGVACRLRESPIADAAEVSEALITLRSKFATPDHEGPSAYAKFLMGLTAHPVEVARGEAVRHRRDAHGAMQQFLIACGEADPPRAGVMAEGI